MLMHEIWRNRTSPISLAEIENIKRPVDIRRVESGGKLLTLSARWETVDDDGGFDPERGNRLLLVSFLGGKIGPMNAIAIARKIISDLHPPIYVYHPNEGADGVVQVCYFLSRSGWGVYAPSNFDWWKFSYGEPKFSILQILDGCGGLSTVYRSLDVPFYLPYLDSRGRYWHDMIVSPPDGDSVFRHAFDGLRGGVSRISAISTDIQPVSMRFSSGGQVELVLKRKRNGRCYLVRWPLPSRSQMDSGGFFLPGDIIDIRSPEQFAAASIARLKEIGAASVGFGGEECECPK